jgi:uncharacterized membrane protein
MKNHFLRGIFFLLPIGLSLYVIYYLARLIYRGLDFVIDFLPESLAGSTMYNVTAVVASLVILFFVTVLIGVIMRTVVGRFFEGIADRLFGSVPLIKLVYNSLKQSFDLIVQGKDERYLETVLVKYPREGSWAIAFLTGKCSDKTAPSPDRTYYTVFLPSTPNPTTGFLLIVPEDDIIRTEMTKSETFKLIFSGGIIKEDTQVDTRRSGSETGESGKTRKSFRSDR